MFVSFVEILKKNHNIQSANADTQSAETLLFPAPIGRISDSASGDVTLILDLAVTLGVNFYSNLSGKLG